MRFIETSTVNGVVKGLSPYLLRETVLVFHVVHARLRIRNRELSLPKRTTFGVEGDGVRNEEMV